MKGLKRIAAAVTACIMAIAALPGAAKEEGQVQVIKPNPFVQSPFGEFEGWGTSLCWWANYIGYSEQLTKTAAEAFFSAEKGLGMNIARYNIGGGDGTHTHIYEGRPDGAMPGLAKGYDKNGSLIWDWDADENQVNVLKAAVAAGADTVEAFANSAPYFMTESGCATGGCREATKEELEGFWENQKKPENERTQFFCKEDGVNITMEAPRGTVVVSDASVDNLAPENYNVFADYLTEVVKHFEGEGITFASLSPFNEPDTTYWGFGSPKQEGMHISPGKAQSALTLAVKQKMDEKGISVPLVGTEETDINRARINFEALSPEARDAIGRINVHSYAGSDRTALKETAASYEKGLWMSEVDGGSAGGENAGSMGPGLWLAGRINEDINGMMPTGWVIWQAIDRHINDRYPNEEPPSDNGYWGTAVADHRTGELILTKKYYTFGQYTRFIRPGYTIIDSGDENTVAAYDKKTGKAVLVMSNPSNQEKSIKVDLSKFTNIGTKVQAQRTSAEENWASLPEETLKGKEYQAVLAPNSVTTYVISHDLADCRAVELVNQNGTVLEGTYHLEKTEKGSKIVSNESTEALMENLTFGEDGAGFALSQQADDIWNITAQNGQQVGVDASGALAYGKDTLWHIYPKFEIASMAIGVGDTIIPAGQQVELDILSEPRALLQEEVVWTVMNLDGTISDRARIEVKDGKPVLFASKGGDVVIRAALLSDETVYAEASVMIADEQTYFTFTNKKSGKKMNIENRSYENGVQAVQEADSGYASQQWRMGFTGQGDILLENRKTRKCLRPSEDTPQILQGTEKDIQAQWMLETVGEGEYRIRSKTSGNYLTVSVASTKDGAPLISYDKKGGDEQIWEIAVAKSPEIEPPTAIHPSKRLTGELYTTDSQPWEGAAASNVLDNRLDTYFDSTQANGVYVGLKLNEPSTVGIISYAPRKGYAQRMVGGRFQGYNRGDDSYTDLYVIETMPPEGEVTTVKRADPTPYRYVRYLAPDGSYGNAAELAFYSDGVMLEGSASKDGAIQIACEFLKPNTGYILGMASFDAAGTLTGVQIKQQTSSGDRTMQVQFSGTVQGRTKVLLWNQETGELVMQPLVIE